MAAIARMEEICLFEEVALVRYVPKIRMLLN